MFKVKVTSNMNLTIPQSKLLGMLGKLTVEELRKAVDMTTLTNKKGIKKSIHYKVIRGKYVRIVSEHPAFLLDVGVHPHKMTYIKNKVVPIPLDKARNPTERDKKRGVALRYMVDPKHPGYEALKFVEPALQRAQDRFVEYLFQEV